MNYLVVIFALTSAIAVASALSADHAPVANRLLPWTAGLLLGIGGFWILPEMAQDRGWLPASAAVFGTLIALALFDRYVYPICPFCAAGMHAHGEDDLDAHRHHTLTLTWPLLLFGCIHVFFDGWTIALAQTGAAGESSTSLSWAATVHKMPESLAIGLLAARLTANRKTALIAIGLLQLVMAIGAALALTFGRRNPGWAEFSAIPACAFLLLFGLLTLQQEWKARGGASAMIAAAPGLLGCGAVALATSVVR